MFSWGFLIYFLVGAMVLIIVLVYVQKLRWESKVSESKIDKAKQEGSYEPVSLYPVIDPDRCIRSGACVKSCPEHDILGIRSGRGTIINASQCIGHGACFRACPTHAISLWIGTEKRGVDLPEVFPNFETNVPGIFIAGELGGMGLIKNAIVQGKEAAENIASSINRKHHAAFDLVVVGAGPAGISATLTAQKAGLKVLTLEQETIGGTVATFPRTKVVMTSPVELPLYGRLKFRETSKTELLAIWLDVIEKHKINLREKCKVESIQKESDYFMINTNQGYTISSKSVLLAIGRRGTPRKLNVPGEDLEKVAYRLLEPENLSGKDVLIVGGGDSAIESAMLLAERNQVSISYRNEKFNRIKPKNAEKIMQQIENGSIQVLFNTQVSQILDLSVLINNAKGEITEIPNDLIYIFAGGELPTEFLKNSGVQMTTKKGEVFISH